MSHACMGGPGPATVNQRDDVGLLALEPRRRRRAQRRDSEFHGPWWMYACECNSALFLQTLAGTVGGFGAMGAESRMVSCSFAGGGTRETLWVNLKEPVRWSWLRMADLQQRLLAKCIMNGCSQKSGGEPITRRSSDKIFRNICCLQGSNGWPTNERHSDKRSTRNFDAVAIIQAGSRDER